MGNTDKSLIEAHLRGDKMAFRELVQRHGGSLLGYLVHMTGNRDQAEDIFQETFKRVHEKADTFAGDHFRNWLFAIATHLAIDSLRKRKRRRFASLNQAIDCGDGDCRDSTMLAAAEDTCDPVDEAAKSEQKAKVRQAIDSLPAKQRAALVLAYYQQLSYSQVAQVLGCSVGAVKTQMYRALHRLAEKLPESLGAVK